MIWAKRIAMILVGLAIVAAIVWGMLPKPVPSDIATVYRGNLEVSVTEEGKTRVKERFFVVAPIIADKTRTLVKAGDTIGKGDVICWLIPQSPILLNARSLGQAKATVSAAKSNSERSKSQVKAAKAERDFVKSDYERKKELVLNEHVSQEKVDAAFARWESSEAVLQAAEHAEQAAIFQLAAANAGLINTNDGLELPHIALKSPSSGVVLRVFNESAGAVSPTQQLIEIGDINSVEIVVELLTRQAVSVKEKQRVEIRQWGGDAVLVGQVRAVEPGAFTKISALGVEEQRTNVVITLGGKSAALKDGYRVEVRIITTQRKDVLRIPSGALFNTDEGKSVFVVRNGEAVLTPVQIGEGNGSETVVIKGLDVGEEVVVHPAEEISDGTSITSR